MELRAKTDMTQRTSMCIGKARRDRDSFQSAEHLKGTKGTECGEWEHKANGCLFRVGFENSYLFNFLFAKRR